jgi:group I intron endonuclease
MIIYKIKNKINEKIYIGQTKGSIQDRFNQHCNNIPTDSAITAAIRKYGKENFQIEEIAKADNQEQLDVLEKTYIQLTNSLAPNGYNLKTGGLEGSRYSEESRKKMSNAKLGRTLSESTKQKMSETHKISLQDPDLRARRGERLKERFNSDPDLREKISNIRTQYWSNEENRQRASERAKANMTDDLKDKISSAVKASFQDDNVKNKIAAAIDRQKKPVVRSDGAEFESVKSAAEASNTSGGAIIRQIKGRYKTAGGYTFTYKESKEIDKPVVYLVCGVSGSGKSWVCNQLKDIANYVSFDDTPKSDHLTLLKESALPALYDPTFKISTFIKRNLESFDIRPVFIIESEDVIRARLLNRGGSFSEKTLNRMRAIDKRTVKYGIFSGTSQEVLDYLKKELTTMIK